MLAFGARLAVVTTATAAPTTPAALSAAKIAFAALFIAMTLAFASLAVGPWSAIITAEATLIALTATAMAAATAMTMPMTTAIAPIAFGTRFAFGPAACRGAGIFAAAEQTFQPTHEAAGFFLGRRLRLVRLIRARFETSLIATLLRLLLLTWITLVARITLLTWIPLLARFTRLTLFTRFARLERTLLAVLTIVTAFAIFAEVAALAIGPEGRPIFPTLLAGGFGRTGGTGFPTHGSALGLLGRKNLELCFVCRVGNRGGRSCG